MGMKRCSREYHFKGKRKGEGEKQNKKRCGIFSEKKPRRSQKKVKNRKKEEGEEREFENLNKENLQKLQKVLNFHTNFLSLSQFFKG